MRIDLSTCRDPDLLAAEVRRLRAAIAALADQEATLSVCEGNVTVTMDAILTDEERAAVCWAAALEPAPNGRWTKSDDETWNKRAATLLGLLERTA
jgi:hypothetical protein